MDWRDSLKMFAEENNLSVQPEDSPATSDDDTATAITRQNLEIILEKKGRGGKTATIIAGFTCPEAQIRSILKFLQQKIGTGGSSRDNEILIQGDRRQKVAELLRQAGHKVKGNIG